MLFFVCNLSEHIFEKYNLMSNLYSKKYFQILYDINFYRVHEICKKNIRCASTISFVKQNTQQAFLFRKICKLKVIFRISGLIEHKNDLSRCLKVYKKYCMFLRIAKISKPNGDNIKQTFLKNLESFIVNQTTNANDIKAFRHLNRMCTDSWPHQKISKKLQDLFTKFSHLPFKNLYLNIANIEPESLWNIFQKAPKLEKSIFCVSAHLRNRNFVSYDLAVNTPWKLKIFSLSIETTSELFFSHIVERIGSFENLRRFTLFCREIQEQQIQDVYKFKNYTRLKFLECLNMRMATKTHRQELLEFLLELFLARSNILSFSLKFTHYGNDSQPIEETGNSHLALQIDQSLSLREKQLQDLDLQFYSFDTQSIISSIELFMKLMNKSSLLERLSLRYANILTPPKLYENSFHKIFNFGITLSKFFQFETMGIHINPEPNVKLEHEEILPPSVLEELNIIIGDSKGELSILHQIPSIPTESLKIFRFKISQKWQESLLGVLFNQIRKMAILETLVFELQRSEQISEEISLIILDSILAISPSLREAEILISNTSKEAQPKVEAKISNLVNVYARSLVLRKFNLRFNHFYVYKVAPLARVIGRIFDLDSTNE